MPRSGLPWLQLADPQAARMRHVLFFVLTVLSGLAWLAAADAANAPAESPDGQTDAREVESATSREPIGSSFGERWVVTPTLTSNPKLGTSIGAAGMAFFALMIHKPQQLF